MVHDTGFTTFNEFLVLIQISTRDGGLPMGQVHPQNLQVPTHLDSLSSAELFVFASISQGQAQDGAPQFCLSMLVGLWSPH